ncbi:glutaredoxin 3 [Pseudohaliea rubra]|uniref:Glutaredoxin n=1 Tax=Pseudohaliea rubra DSM 19751 TaxID=1265313 RepID=A0A095VR03_9GAMM|nr:glutaredoxin 3 [Pseudohaliea rubra]KGE03897.1 Glutaredoxin 3 (Grx3) [Pseudohaliea rubra DSM 19751]
MAVPVTVYSTRFCPYCIAARRLLTGKGVTFEEIAVDGNAALRAEMTAKAGRHTVPQIWVGEQHVGGFDELAALDRAGRLDALLGLSTPP